MSKRTIPAVVLVCGLIWASTATAATDATPRTAEQMYQQFLQQVQSEDYEGALQTYRRLDPLQLPRDKQTNLHQTVMEIERRLTGETADPAQLLREAEADMSARRFNRAAERYSQVAGSDRATPQQRSTAEAGLASARRQLSMRLEEARQNIARAEAALTRGEVARARTLLSEVQASGLALGRFDTQHMASLIRRVEEIEQRRMPVNEVNGNDEPAQRPADLTNGWDDVPLENDRLAEAPRENDLPVPAGNGEAPTANGEAAAQVEPTPATEERPDPIARAQSQRLVAEGRQALAQDIPNPRLAAEKFRHAMQVDPTNRDAARELQTVQRDYGDVTVRRDLSDVQTEAVRLGIQRTLVEYNDRMEEARARLREGEFDAATRLVSEARIALDRNPNVPRDQYAALVQRASDLRVSIDRSREQREAERLAERDADADRIARLEELQGQARHREQVYSQLSRANQLRMQQRYDEAIELVDQALFLDPTNLPARFFRDTLEESRNMALLRSHRIRRDQYIHRHHVENLEATTPHDELVTFPSDWRELSIRRWRGLADAEVESEADLRTQNTLQMTTVTLLDEERPLDDMIREFRDTSGLNILPNWAEIEQFFRRDDTVRVPLRNVPMDRALRLVLENASPELGYVIEDGIVRISSLDDLRGRLELQTYDVRDMLFPPRDHDAPAVGELGGTGTGTGTGAGGGGAGGGLFGGGFGGDPGDPQQVMEDAVQELRTLIEQTVGRVGDWELGSGEISHRQGVLIVRTTAANHREIRQLLGRLRATQADQIHLEARFLTVTQNFLHEVGIDLDINIQNTGRWGDVGIAQDSFGMTARPQTGLPGGFGPAALPTYQVFQGDPGDPEADPPVPASGAFDPIRGFVGSGRALDLSAAYLDDVEVTLLLRATQASRTSVNLSAPRITFFNGQQVYITIASRQDYIGNLSPVSGTAGADTDIDSADSGVSLTVRGTISADRRFVTLDIFPRVFDADLSNQQTVQQGVPATGTGTGVIGGEVGEPGVIENTVTLPQRDQTELRTTVSVPDRGTLLLGGQRLVREIEVESGVPILSKIPILNRLFSNKTTVKDEQTLLILVKPTIIIMDELEDLNFPGLLDNPRAFRVGRAMQ
ncbi:MAG: hypothetical protein JJU36_17350 [Phycisphaeraceae bacterium]|nr:hypothetical protein [Phycisphaeraceae bacterium]